MDLGELYVPIISFSLLVVGYTIARGCGYLGCTCDNLDDMCPACIESEFNDSSNPLLSPAELSVLKNE